MQTNTVLYHTHGFSTRRYYNKGGIGAGVVLSASLPSSLPLSSQCQLRPRLVAIPLQAQNLVNSVRLTSTRILGSTAHTLDFPSWSRLDPSLTFSLGAKNDFTLLHITSSEISTGGAHDRIVQWKGSRAGEGRFGLDGLGYGREDRFSGSWNFRSAVHTTNKTRTRTKNCRGMGPRLYVLHRLHGGVVGAALECLSFRTKSQRSRDKK